MAPGPDYLSLTPGYLNQFLGMRPPGIFLMLSVGSTMESDLDIINPMCNSSVQVHIHSRPSLLGLSAYITGSDGETWCKPSREDGQRC